MKSSKWKTLWTGLGTALALTALPFTMSATNTNGEFAMEFGSNVACAEGQDCCMEIGMMCVGRPNWGYCDL